MDFFDVNGGWAGNDANAISNAVDQTTNSEYISGYDIVGSENLMCINNRFDYPNEEKLLLAPCTNGNLGGTVFNDFNGNGKPNIHQVDCGDVENSPVEVNMYVWDEKGNADFCMVFLTLVDNSGACGGKPDIAEEDKATMKVFDVAGKVIVVKNIEGVRGYNTVNFTAKELGASGVLYYRLESGDFTATKKMIVIE